MIYLVRHGQTVWNAEGKKQGHHDSPLTWNGIEQAANVSCAFWNVNHKKFSFFASPLNRVRQFASLVMEKMKVPHDKLKYSDMLKECSFGAWEGLSEKDIKERFPKAWDKREKNKWDFDDLKVESYGMLSHRTGEFLTLHQENMVVFTHEMVSKVIRGRLMNLSRIDTMNLKHPQNVVYLLDDGHCEELTV